jgi:thiamine biosynthesis lipoprotein
MRSIALANALISTLLPTLFPLFAAPGGTASEWVSAGVGAELMERRQEGEAPAPAAQRCEYRRLAMGVEARLVLYAADQASADRAAERAFQRLAELEAAWSHWSSDSELTRLVLAAGRGPVAVSQDLLRALTLARGLAELSAGAFDPTGAPLYRLWSAAREAGQLPDPEELAEARARVGWRRLTINPGASTAELVEGTELDLGGIGKGLAADDVLELLRALDVPSALVEIGGDLALGDPPPGEPGWRIQAGSGRPGSPGELLYLAHCGVATSGDSEQALDIGGQRHSHLIDPQSGAAMTHGRTITVVAETGALADGLATACSVLDPDAAQQLLDRFPGALFLLEPAPGAEAPAWRSLFDGHSLAGWVTRGGRYDGAALWSVEDGVLVGRTDAAGEGGLIYTEELFSSFEIEFDVALDYPFDSGLFVRMLPPGEAPEAAAALPWSAPRPPRADLKGAQVTLDHRDGGEIAAIYADGFLMHNEAAAAHFRRGEWNRVRCRVTGFDFRIETWINGVSVGDYRLPAGSPGYAPYGRIGLQVHPADPALKDRCVRFRDIRLRELPHFDAADWSGWQDLFAGGLAGLEFSGGSEGYRLEDGILRVPSQGGGQVETRSLHQDFRMRAEFRLARMANSGLFLRALKGGANPAYSGHEVQLIDDLHWGPETGSPLLPYQTTGGLYGAFPPGPAKRFHPPGQWNLLEVLMQGQRLAVALNGQTLYDLDLSVLPADPPFPSRAPRGFLGWQRYGAPNVTLPFALEVRHWRVQDLPPAEPPR